MTVRPLIAAAPPPRLRVIAGRPQRPVIAPWMLFTVMAVVAFLGLVLTRTALDRTAFELAEVQRSIAEQASLNQRLRLELARLESPRRVAPLAAQLGMVQADEKIRLVVEGVATVAQPAPDPRWAGLTRLAAPAGP